MTISLHQGGLVMSSQITHTESKNLYSLALILDPCALIFSSCALFTVYPNRIIKLDPISLLVITTSAWEGCSKELRANQKWPHESHSVTYAPGRYTLSYLLRIAEQHPSSFLCCPRHLHIIHPAKPRSISYGTSTYFRHQLSSGHMVL